MKRFTHLLAAALSCLILSACADGAGGAAVSSAARLPAPVPSASAPAASSGEPAGAPAEGKTLEEKARAAFQSALENLLKNHVFPDGAEADSADPAEMSKNSFAITDVDSDGKEELLINYTTACMAGMTTMILGYDGGALHTQLTEFPDLTIFDNGIIQAGWSHNQGLGGSFWPFSLYQYNVAADSYVLVGMVDAWDESLDVPDYPSEVDVSKSGFVYYIMDDGQYDNSNPVDSAVYQDWLAGYLGSAKSVFLSWQPLTEENIEAIL